MLRICIYDLLEYGDTNRDDLDGSLQQRYFILQMYWNSSVSVLFIDVNSGFDFECIEIVSSFLVT